MRPMALARATLLAATMLLLAAGPGIAQKFPRELRDIKLYGKGETIEFIFSHPYEADPVQEHERGRFSLGFSGTGSIKPVRTLEPVEESIYKEIKVVQNRYSTTVSFLLKDTRQSLKDKLAFSHEKNVLRLQVNAPPKPLPASAEAEATRDLLREMEQRIAGQPPSGTGSEGSPTPGRSPGSSLTFGDLSGGQFFYSLATMVIALVIIVAALYGLLYVYNRYFATRLRRFTSSHSIRQVASFHIGPRQRIVVLDINGELIACGVTPNQISYLTHLGGKGAVGSQAAAVAAAISGHPANDDPEGGLRAAAPTDLHPVKGDPVHQFAEVLKQKVRSLKRIN